MARTPPTLGQLKGRSRISGAGKPPKKFKRVAISYAYKLSVVEFYDAVVSKDKMHLTVKHFYPELLGDSCGTKYDPPSTDSLRAWENSVFQHGFGAQLWKQLRGEQNEVQIYGNAAGWWNSELTIQFLLHHFRHRENMDTPVLLLLDEFSGHWRLDVQIFARLLNVELMAIPAGYTFACQPADISWNKPLKDKMRKNWVENMLEQLRASTSTLPFKIKAPTRQQLIGWTKNSWKACLAKRELDWGLLRRLLEEVPVVRHAVDTRHDIENFVVPEEELDN
ncbi:Hypothetical protein PHPALM_8576 [Phytophthora palmivora]|uniref:DDE-1 domain-containing protein n=1 Tax=Phytophthora palmivora TaxID=4796 RepID=A0A2P4Y9H1_9STRA|nr:Hypothetical protein PHPALM_8576 [Phytophthora palmivora]